MQFCSRGTTLQERGRVVRYSTVTLHVVSEEMKNFVTLENVRDASSAYWTNTRWPRTDPVGRRTAVHRMRERKCKTEVRGLRAKGRLAGASQYETVQVHLSVILTTKCGNIKQKIGLDDRN